MKKLTIIAFLTLAVAIIGCSDIKRKPNNIYMPDMAYSRAYETYAERDSSKFTSSDAERGHKIFYNNMPVAGTISQGEEMPFAYAKDAVGDTANYVASRTAINPIDSLTEAQLIETERIYLINCGICHGKNLDGNGPLYKDGNGPYPAAPKNLITLNMPDGQMFYSITYGKNLMGGYASQLNRKQRWDIVNYIKHKQAASKSAEAPAKTETAAK